MHCESQIKGDCFSLTDMMIEVNMIFNLSYLLSPNLPGSKLVSSHSMHETSSVMVDPVTRAISCSQQAAPPAQSDASKVVAKGNGLTKGFIGQKNNFSVDCSKAGV